MLLIYFLNNLELVPVAPIITRYHLFIHSTCAVFLLRSLYFTDFFGFFLYHISARLPASPTALLCILPCEYHLLLLLLLTEAGAAVAFAVLRIRNYVATSIVLWYLPDTPFSYGTESTLHGPCSHAICRELLCSRKAFLLDIIQCSFVETRPLLQHYSSTLRIATGIGF
jgi:hypothetical protein